MIGFDWPWLFLLLPMPLLVRRLLPSAISTEGAALKVPFLDDFLPFSEERGSARGEKWPFWIALVAWGLLILAAARPHWMGEPIEQAISGRDLMMAVDLSGSMQEEDFVVNGRRVDRLTATKRVAGSFIERRSGDRIGLILFGDRAYLQAPLTFDRPTVRILLDESAIGLAGERTAIGDAIGLAVKRLRRNREGDRVLILLTDGANTTGHVSPLKAAELASEGGLRIYTIGIGADEMTVRGFFGTRRVNPSVDLDEGTLRGIAEKTGGRYFRARDTAELEKIYGLLDELEPTEKDKRYYRPKTDLYHWPLGAALVLAGLLSASRARGAF
ncbi:MAG: VWA domain-containing protein [Pseudomonadota bacterium]